MDDIAKRLVSAFHNGFKDCKSKVKKIFLDINVALLIPSITDLVKEEEASREQVDIGAPIEAPPLASPKAITIAKVLEVFTNLNQKCQLIKWKKYEGFIFLYFIYLFPTFIFPARSLRTLCFINIFEAMKSIFLNQCYSLFQFL